MESQCICVAVVLLLEMRIHVYLLLLHFVERVGCPELVVQKLLEFFGHPVQLGIDVVALVRPLVHLGHVLVLLLALELVHALVVKQTFRRRYPIREVAELLQRRTHDGVADRVGDAAGLPLV